MAIFQSKTSLKSVVLVATFIFTAGLVTSCGASKEEKALEANCERISTNLKAIENTPEVFKDSDYADSDSVALLLGAETRKKVESRILAVFPFLDEVVVGRERSARWDSTNYYSAAIYLIKQALDGTDVEFPYTAIELKAIASQENGWRDVVNPLATKIFGDYMEFEDHQGCAVIDSKKEDAASEYNTSETFSRASQVYFNYASFLQAVRDCEVSGWHESNKCSKNDYVSKPDNYTPSNEPTAEEIEILAERERQAQNGDQGSPQYSDVSAGQVCNSLGAVVMTENYGELTCKFVIVGRLRSLLWMRS